MKLSTFIKTYESLILVLLTAIMTVVVLVATVELGWLLLQYLLTPPVGLMEPDQLLDVLGMFLLVLIGIELLDTIRTYHAERVLRVEIAIVVALLAISRKVIVLNYKDLTSFSMLDVGVAVVAFAVAYYLLRVSPEGRFLSPLFYRLNVLAITLPPLRDRIEDIPVLLEEIMSRLAAEVQLTTTPAVDPSSVIALARYHWPGNVRELRNVIERALILCDGKKLNLALPWVDANNEAWSHVSSFPEDERTLHDVTDEVIESLCLEALRRCGGNRRCAARTLGIARDSLYRHMKRFGIGQENRAKDDPD
jgi:uncharacterized membrane protein (DUF373 family)